MVGPLNADGGRAPQDLTDCAALEQGAVHGAELKRLRAEGVEIAVPLREEPWGERLFQVTDPNGVIVQFVEWVTASDHRQVLRAGRTTGAARTASTRRRPSVSTGRSSLLKILPMCLFTAASLMNRCLARPASVRPSAISPSTSRSRGLSRSSGSWRSRTSWWITFGSTTVPPAATRSIAAVKSATALTRSLSR